MENEIIIRDRRFTCDRLNAQAALHLGLRVLNVAGALAPAMKFVKTDKEVTDEQALGALGALFSAVDPDKATALIVELVSHARNERGQKCSLNIDFATEDGPDLIGALKLCFFVCKVNFSGILSMLGNSKAGAAPAL